MTSELCETAAITERAAQAAKATGRMRVQFISPGWGSSGYYSPEVLQEAAASRVIPAGTHMYADHPSKSQATDRPERSIRDLMAVTTSDAQLAPNGALVGEVRVLAPYQELLTDLKDHIGVSIRGDATDVYEGEAEGRRGRIIEGLANVTSVDFVTRAGRGGQVLELLESARQLAEVEEAEGDRVFHWKHGWIPVDDAEANDHGGPSKSVATLSDMELARRVQTEKVLGRAGSEDHYNYQQELDKRKRQRAGKPSPVQDSAVPGPVTIIENAWLTDGIHVELAEALEELATSPAGVQGTEKLHAYWRHGEGAAKIRWGVAGDFQRCVDHLGKYVANPKGYCAKMHKDVTGATPGHAVGESLTVIEGSRGRYAVDEAGHTYRYQNGWAPLSEADRVYHFKHGWIPLDHTAAPEALTSRRTKSHVDRIGRPVNKQDVVQHRASGERGTVVGFDGRTKVIVKKGDGKDATWYSDQTMLHGTDKSKMANNAGTKSYDPKTGPSDAEKLANAAKMFGVNSPQYKAAVKKYGKKP